MAARVLEGATSEDPAERTVGIATANALLNRERPGLTEGDTLDLLVAGKEDVVGMVGYFGPVIARLQGQVKELRVFERRPEPARGILPEDQAPDFLRSCSLAFITATSIINRTAEGLLEARARAYMQMVPAMSTSQADGISFSPIILMVTQAAQP